MDCKAYHEDLPDLLYGELRDERKSACESHAASCSACGSLHAELKAVRGALSPMAVPPLLATKIKMAARDELIAQNSPDVALVGGTFHVTATVLLAACVCLAGFGLGIAFERRRDAPADVEQPTLILPRAPEDLASDRPPPFIEISHTAEVPGPSEAWQRVLYDAAHTHLAKGEFFEALEFFQRIESVAPQGALAAPAAVGAAEVHLRLGNIDDSRAKLEAARRDVMGGAIPGNAALLQRIHELELELGPPQPRQE